MSENQYYPGSYYQPLFDHMSHEHGLTLLEGQMADIIHIVNKMQALHPSESAGVTGAVWVKAITYKPTRESEYRPFRRKRDDNEIPYDYGEIYITTDGDTIFFDVNNERQYARSTDAPWNDYDILDESPAIAQPGEHPHQSLFDQYHAIKEKIGKLGYNTFIHSKEVEEYREWLRNDKYKHRLEWFENEYPNGLYSKDNDGELFGINIMTKKFLAEADAAYEAAAAQSGKEEAVKLFQRILNQANHARNTSGIDRLPAIKRLAKQGIEIFDPNNKALED